MRGMLETGLTVGFAEVECDYKNIRSANIFTVFTGWMVEDGAV